VIDVALSNDMTFEGRVVQINLDSYILRDVKRVTPLGLKPVGADNTSIRFQYSMITSVTVVGQAAPQDGERSPDEERAAPVPGATDHAPAPHRDQSGQWKRQGRRQDVQTHSREYGDYRRSPPASAVKIHLRPQQYPQDAEGADAPGEPVPPGVPKSPAPPGQAMQPSHYQPSQYQGYEQRKPRRRGSADPARFQGQTGDDDAPVEQMLTDVDFAEEREKFQRECEEHIRSQARNSGRDPDVEVERRMGAYNGAVSFFDHTGGPVRQSRRE